VPEPFSIADSSDRSQVSRLSFLRAACVCAVLASSVLAVAAEGPRTPSPAFDQTAYMHPQRLVAVGGRRRPTSIAAEVASRRSSSKPGPAGRCWTGTRSSLRSRAQLRFARTTEPAVSSSTRLPRRDRASTMPSTICTRFCKPPRSWRPMSLSGTPWAALSRCPLPNGIEPKSRGWC
jgi:hypothetical protein